MERVERLDEDILPPLIGFWTKNNFAPARPTVQEADRHPDKRDDAGASELFKIKSPPIGAVTIPPLVLLDSGNVINRRTYVKRVSIYIFIFMCIFFRNAIGF